MIRLQGGVRLQGSNPPRRRPRHLEDNEAMALIRWRDSHVRQYPQLALLIHIPNGGKRNAREAARFKAMGVKAGVSDYFLPIPSLSHNAPGLWIELKAGSNRPTIEQSQWLVSMLGEGYAAVVAQGWVDAAHKICRYIGCEEIAP